MSDWFSAGGLRLTLRAIAICCLAVYGTSVAWSLAPRVLGWQAAVITSGSMMPSVRPGDVVVYAPITDTTLVPGQVVVFESPTRPGTLLSHRIVSIDPERGLITKGDANLVNDSDPVRLDQVRGLARILVPYVGRVTLLRTENWAGGAEVLGILIAAALVLVRTDDRPPARGVRGVREFSGTADRRRSPRTPPRHRRQGPDRRWPVNRRDERVPALASQEQCD